MRLAAQAVRAAASACAANRIAVTPLRLDMTDEPYLTPLASVFS